MEAEMNATAQRPEYVTEAHLLFLDELRASGETNMYGAGLYLVDEFEVSKDVSHKILSYWMKSFGQEAR